MRLAFFSVLVDQDGVHSVMEGNLFDVPPELRDAGKIREYVGLVSPGWHQTEAGYDAFVFYDRVGLRFVMPALFLRGVNRKKRQKIYGYKAQFSKGEIEEYIQNWLNGRDKYRSEIEADLGMLVHDLRRLSSSIYHAAEHAKASLKESDTFSLNRSLDTVIAAQTMLTIRTDFLDFSSSPDGDRPSKEIPIYRRLDKVIKCFRPYAVSRGIQIKISGESYNTTFGPNVFEIIPYILIDNAVKYGLSGREIKVEVFDSGVVTEIIVESLGPKIDNGEVKRIFERGYRGNNAVKANQAGSGLGLYLASNLVKKFDGEIFIKSIEGDEEFDVGGATYCVQSFHVRLPSKPNARNSIKRGRKKRKAW